MSRRCALSGKSVATGNNVSHALNRTRRRFIPNLQRVSLSSEILGHSVSFRICTQALRTIEVNGGLDAWLLNTASRKLTPTARTLKKRLLRTKATA